RRLTDFSAREGVTPFMALLGAFAVLLHRYTGQTDLAVGSPIANRNRLDTEGLIGFFINTLVLRCDVRGAPTFLELLGRLKPMTLEAYAHQDAPFERIVEAVKPERELGRTPLFQVAFIYENTPMPALELRGIQMTREATETGTSRFDLSLYV